MSDAPKPIVDLDALRTALAGRTGGPWDARDGEHRCVDVYGEHLTEKVAHIECDVAPLGMMGSPADARAIVSIINASDALIALASAVVRWSDTRHAEQVSRIHAVNAGGINGKAWDAYDAARVTHNEAMLGLLRLAAGFSTAKGDGVK